MIIVGLQTMQSWAHVNTETGHAFKFHHNTLYIDRPTAELEMARLWENATRLKKSPEINKHAQGH